MQRSALSPAMVLRSGNTRKHHSHKLRSSIGCTLCRRTVVVRGCELLRTRAHNSQAAEQRRMHAVQTDCGRSGAVNCIGRVHTTAKLRSSVGCTQCRRTVIKIHTMKEASCWHMQLASGIYFISCEKSDLVDYPYCLRRRSVIVR